jgi:hypothetical protein
MEPKKRYGSWTAPKETMKTIHEEQTKQPVLKPSRGPGDHVSEGELNMQVYGY